MKRMRVRDQPEGSEWGPEIVGFLMMLVLLFGTLGAAGDGPSLGSNHSGSGTTPTAYDLSLQDEGSRAEARVESGRRSPFLGAAANSFEVSTLEIAPRGLYPTQVSRVGDPPHSRVGSLSSNRSRIAVIELIYSSFAASLLAVRAGLLARGATSPPPPPFGLVITRSI